MTIEEVIYGVKRIISRSSITVENRHSDNQILAWMNAARMALIEEDLKAGKEPDLTLYQSLGKIALSPTDSEYTVLTLTGDPLTDPVPDFGITTLPFVCTIPGLNSVFVYTADRKKTIQVVSPIRMSDMIAMGHPSLEYFSIASIEGRILRVNPYAEYIHALAILRDVMDGTQTDLTHQTRIKPGVTYVVVSGELDYYEVDQVNGVDVIEPMVFGMGEEFVGLQDYPVYEADAVYGAIVNYKVPTSSVTYASPYPASLEMIRKMTLMVLTQELKIESGVASDFIYDMQDNTGK